MLRLSRSSLSTSAAGLDKRTSAIPPLSPEISAIGSRLIFAEWRYPAGQPSAVSPELSAIGSRPIFAEWRSSTGQPSAVSPELSAVGIGTIFAEWRKLIEKLPSCKTLNRTPHRRERELATLDRKSLWAADYLRHRAQEAYTHLARGSQNVQRQVPLIKNTSGGTPIFEHSVFYPSLKQKMREHRSPVFN